MSLAEKINDNYVTINSKKILSFIDNEKQIWFNAKQILLALEYKKCHDAVKNISLDNKQSYNKINVVNPEIEKIKNFQKHSIFINENGLRYIICSSRNPKTIEIAKLLNINIVEHKALSKETDTLSKIMKVFKKEKMELQYTVFNYRIDLYFIDYKIAVECDENGHKNRDEEYEKTRQYEITNELKCNWVRYNPDSKDFDILDVISDIYELTKNYNKI